MLRASTRPSLPFLPRDVEEQAYLRCRCAESLHPLETPPGRSGEAGKTANRHARRLSQLRIYNLEKPVLNLHF